MSTISQQPDSLSFSGNLKKFIVASGSDVVFVLKQGETTILDELFVPDDGVATIDVKEVIDRLLSITLPVNSEPVTSQTAAFADFTAEVDDNPIVFRVIKAGVADLQEMASDFVDDHFLTWQAQEKRILQVQPEWITLYATAARVVKCKAWFLTNGEIDSETVTLATVDADTMQTIDVSWQAICDAITATQPIAWDVWFEDDNNTRLSYIQRYQLRLQGEEENIFIWCNTLGGIDSASFLGFAEDDQKLEHKVAELYDESLAEYQVDKKTEIKQSTGLLTARESIWMRDFFYSKRRYRVWLDGSVKAIVLVSSKVVASTADDLFDYEFNYRYVSDESLLNLDRVNEELTAPEGLDLFFLTELLAGLPTADYDGNLNIPVQSPFAEGWMKLSFHELWQMAMPTLVDNKTVVFINGKLQSFGAASTNATIIPFEDKQYPEITDYHLHYFETYGDWPILRLFTVDTEKSLPEGVPPKLVLRERFEKPTFTIDDGKLETITYDLDREEKGYIILN